MANPQTKEASFRLPVELLLPAVGLFLSIYATQHYMRVNFLGETDSVCNVNQVLNCDKVALSSWSTFLEIPLGVWGAGYFCMVLLVELTLSRRNGYGAALQGLNRFLAAVGLITTIILASISIFILQSLCLVCAGVYVVNILRGAIMMRGAVWRQMFDVRPLLSPSMAFLMVPFVVAGGFHLARPRLSEMLKRADQEHFAAIADLREFLDTSTVTPELIDRQMIRQLPYEGPLQAPIVLTEFVDLQCPNCEIFARIVKDLHRLLPDDLLIVARQFPLDKTCNEPLPMTLHENSCTIAKAALCAHEAGRFWDFAAFAFQQDGILTAEITNRALKSYGLDEQAVQTCTNGSSVSKRLQNDIDLGTKLKISGTPGVYLNGMHYTGVLSVNALLRCIQMLRG